MPIFVPGTGGATTFDGLTDVDFTAADKAIPVWDAGLGLLKAGAYASSPIIKPSDTTRNNTFTLADDPHLTLPLIANQIQHVAALILYTGTTVARFRHAWTYPAATTIRLATTGLAVAAPGPSGSNYSSVNDEASGTAFETGIGANTSKYFLRVEGIIRVGANAGNLVFQWAQQTQEVSDLIVHADSYILPTRLG